MEQIIRSVGRITAAKTVQQIGEILGSETGRLGFEWFAYDILVMPDGWGNRLVCSNYPKDWLAHYVEQRYTRDDIVVGQAMASVAPTIWRRSVRHPHLTERQRLLLDEAADIGLKAGAIVPIHGPGLAKAVLAVSSPVSDQEFDRLFANCRHELQIIATCAHETALKLGVTRPAPSLALSPREVEVLTWTALGYSAQDISDRLKISHHTINQHIESAKNKLGTRNKTHAASVAISLGIIRL